MVGKKVTREYSVIVNGKNLSEKGAVIDSRANVPARALSEALGADVKVSWKTSTITTSEEVPNEGATSQLPSNENNQFSGKSKAYLESTKKGNIVFWSIIVLVVLLIGIAIIDKSLDKPDDVNASVTETKDITTFDRFYHPSAFVIDSLIRKAEEFEGYDYYNYLKSLRLPLKENTLVTAKEYPPFVSLYSPQSTIVQKAYHASQKMNTYTAEEAKSDVIENVLSFKTTAYKDINDTGKQFHVVLRQGETVLQPASDGYKSSSIKSNVSYDDNLSPTSKRYNREEGYVVFSVGEELDFNKPAEVLFLYNGKDDYAVYELDFKKFIGD